MPEISSGPEGKESRILRAARDLLLAHGYRGVTMAEVARWAHVGKGTVYLYWPTKEELFVEIFLRDVLGVIEELAETISADPATVLPHNLFPRMQTIIIDRPFLRALQTADIGLLGLLTEHPRAVELSRTLSPEKLLAAILPGLREHGLVRTDLPVDVQVYAGAAVANGFLGLATGVFPPLGIGTRLDDPEDAYARTVQLLLEPAVPAGRQAVERAAADARSVIAAMQQAVTAPDGS